MTEQIIIMHGKEVKIMHNVLLLAQVYERHVVLWRDARWSEVHSYCRQFPERGGAIAKGR